MNCSGLYASFRAAFLVVINLTLNQQLGQSLVCAGSRVNLATELKPTNNAVTAADFVCVKIAIGPTLNTLSQQTRHIEPVLG